MGPATSVAPSFQASKSAQWLAVVLGALPMYAIAIYGGLSSRTPIASQLGTAEEATLGTLLELAIFGGSMLACLVALNGQSVPQLNLQRGTLGLDCLMGLGAFALLVFAVIAFGLITSQLGAETVPAVNLELGRILAKDPTLAAAVLGPVVWLKAALLEEFSRVFMLSRLWRAHPSHTAKLLSLCGVTLLFGLAHFWQGWIGVVGTAVIGGVLGWLYLRFGRVLPLVIAHGLYDTLIFLVLIAVGRSDLPMPSS